MKRIVALFVFFLALSACSGRSGPAALLDRETLLPVDRVSELTGVPMRLVHDRREEDAGYVSWAWEETEGLPRLLVVEIRFPPADCGRIFEEAKAGSEPLTAMQGITACQDGRAMHVMAGSYYIKVVMLGISDEEEARNQIITRLAGALRTKD